MSTETFQTSKEAYDYCVANGLISKRVQEVLQVLNYGSAPAMNQTMVHQAIVRMTGNVALEKYSVSPRFAVLERMGLIREAGRQPCPVTRRTTMFYEATTNRPRCTEAEAMKAPNRRETIAALKKELAEVRGERDQLRELLNLRSASFHERERRLASSPVLVQTSFL